MRIIILGTECRDKEGIWCARMTENARKKEYFCRVLDNQKMCSKSCDKCGEPNQKHGKAFYTLTAKYLVTPRLSNMLMASIFWLHFE